MAQFVTMDQAHDFEIDGKTYDLVKLIEELDAVPTGWTSPVGADELSVGQTVHVWFSGKLRCGVVSKVGRARVTVVFTTKDAVEEGKLYSGAGAIVKVTDTAVHVDMIYYPAPNVRLTALRESRYEEAKAEDLARSDSSENQTGSSVIKLLERVWARIREDHPDLPEVMIVTGSGLVGANKWGHFRPEGWRVKEEGAAIHRHELFLSGEALAKGARQVLQTILHEGAHTLARVRDLKDTSRQGRWHNQVFRKLAEEMGLEHRSDKADTRHGFSFVTLTEDTAERYADLLTELDREITVTCHLPVWMGGSADDGKESGDGERITGKPRAKAENKSGNLKAECECPEPNIIRASRKILDKLVIRCDDCEQLFKSS